MEVRIVPPGEEVRTICHAFTLVGDQYNLVYQGSPFDSDLEESDSPLFDAVFTYVVKGSLGQLQITLANLLHQLWVGDVVCVALRNKSQQLVASWQCRGASQRTEGVPRLSSLTGG